MLNLRSPIEQDTRNLLIGTPAAAKEGGVVVLISWINKALGFQHVTTAELDQAAA
jgi:hypothetical protein